MPLGDRWERINQAKNALIEVLKSRNNKSIPMYQAVEIIKQTTRVRQPTAEEYLDELKNAPEFDCNAYELKIREAIA